MPRIENKKDSQFAGSVWFGLAEIIAPFWCTTFVDWMGTNSKRNIAIAQYGQINSVYQ